MTSVAGVDYEEYTDHYDAVVSGEAVLIPSRPAGFVQRAASAAIDVIATVALFIGASMLTSFILDGITNDQALLTAINLALLVTILLIVPITVETLTHGKSLGRLALGLRIVRDDGGAIGLRHAMIRGFMSLIDFYMSFGGVALLVGILNSRAKRLGDLLAGTYSQQERLPALTATIYGVPVSLIEWAQTADVARLPDGLARRISSFLSKAPNLTAATRENLSRQLAQETSAYVSPLPPVAAELFLAGVIALRRDRETIALELEAKRMASLAPVLTGLPHRFPVRDEVPAEANMAPAGADSAPATNDAPAATTAD
jgi:uncharacterized RDD family membrane protein YckC